MAAPAGSWPPLHHHRTPSRRDGSRMWSRRPERRRSSASRWPRGGDAPSLRTLRSTSSVAGGRAGERCTGAAFNRAARTGPRRAPTNFGGVPCQWKSDAEVGDLYPFLWTWLPFFCPATTPMLRDSRASHNPNATRVREVQPCKPVCECDSCKQMLIGPPEVRSADLFTTFGYVPLRCRSTCNSFSSIF